MEIRTPGARNVLSAQDLAILEPAEEHAVQALSSSVLLLVLLPGERAKQGRTAAAEVASAAE